MKLLFTIQISTWIKTTPEIDSVFFQKYIAAYLIKNQQRPSIITSTTQGLQELLCCTVYSTFTLDRFHKYCSNFATLNQFPSSVYIAILQKSNSRHDRFKRWSVILFACQSKWTHGPPMEAIRKRNKLCCKLLLIRMQKSLEFSCKFDSSFICFCSRVWEEDPISKRTRHKTFCKLNLWQQWNKF